MQGGFRNLGPRTRRSAQISPAHSSKARSFTRSHHFPNPVGISNPQDKPFSQNTRCAGYGINRHRGVLWIQQTIELRPTGMQFPSHCSLRFLLLLHRLLKLPGKNSFHGDSFNFFPNSFFLKKTVEARAAVVVRCIRLLLFHLSPC